MGLSFRKKIYRSAGPHSLGISPAEITGLGSVLDLVTVLAARCDQARLAMAEHPGWSLVPSLLGLLSCAVPTQIKAKLLQLLAAIARTPDIVHPLWQALEGAGLLAGSRAGLVAELEEVEARQEEFPFTAPSNNCLTRSPTWRFPARWGRALGSLASSPT